VPRTGDKYHDFRLVPGLDWEISFQAETDFYPKRGTTEIRVPVQSLKISGGTFVQQGIENHEKFRAAVKGLIRALLQSKQGWKDTGSCFGDLQQ
jgi:hypothetical protein